MSGIGRCNKRESEMYNKKCSVSKTCRFIVGRLEIIGIRDRSSGGEVDIEQFELFDDTTSRMCGGSESMKSHKWKQYCELNPGDRIHVLFTANEVFNENASTLIMRLKRRESKDGFDAISLNTAELEENIVGERSLIAEYILKERIKVDDTDVYQEILFIPLKSTVE